MLPINMPRTNSNDNMCTLVQWLYTSGQRVREGEVLAYLETSKATEDLLSPGTGILHELAPPGEEYEPGYCIGYLLMDEDSASSGPVASSHASKPVSFVLTRNAQELVKRYNIADEQLASLGKKVLKKDDVQALITPPQSMRKQATSEHRSHNQAIVARQVTLAHQSIPAAFSMIKIYCDAALQAMAEYIEREDVIIGWPEVLIHELGKMQQDYFAFYQHLASGEAVAPQQKNNPNIGVTIDVGTGLYIPVIKGVATKSLAEIANELMELRLKALRKTLREEELSDGHLTISLHTDKDILMAIPLIFPTQTCMLSLCSEQEELYLNKDKSIGIRHYLTLGVAYDHRSINGADAVRFLQEIKRRLENLKDGGL
ncbi:2-oxo acid dehydrogenase subunit E2 [Dictyobacter aurantiacus]|uniref:Dihydrolipoamide acetyltransferase component of pyruvate dehydrogenase complex n=1 Tax=Dictyobacter aurantiacus TaxID=1936993 RepID=A0A401ZLC5_9CHLR|nr:2-oxo acid dehydrogenase subunit E2 [Dictyobacter aurantiacus]GCE07677.1 dihydrolipoamide acetyltransferase component of pyruvate dehydrogenase complex [Dictyobacter aurantiacus]